MRFTLTVGARSCLIGFLALSLFDLPVMAAGSPSIGMVVIADHALLSGDVAQRGVDVYPGDTLATQSDGSLRLLAGSSQLYLLSSTEVIMKQDGSAVRAKMNRGTIDFSVAPNQFEIETPLGVVRGNGRAVGILSVVNENEITLQSLRGTLTLNADGEIRTVAEGKAYRFVAEAADPQGPAGYPNTARPHHRKRKIAAFLIVGGTAAASYVIWNALTVSPSTLAP